jgi:hypothetical protein
MPRTIDKPIVILARSLRARFQSIGIYFPRWEEIPDEEKFNDTEYYQVCEIIASIRKDGEPLEYREGVPLLRDKNEILAAKLLTGFAEIIEGSV